MFACAGCAGIDVEIVAGEEFLITSLELAETGTGAGAETGAGAGS